MLWMQEGEETPRNKTNTMYYKMLNTICTAMSLHVQPCSSMECLPENYLHDMCHTCATRPNFYELSSDFRRYEILQPYVFYPVL